MKAVTLLALVAAILHVGCGSDSTGAGGAGAASSSASGDGDGDGDGDGGNGGHGGGAACDDPEAGLSGCDVPLACDLMTSHLGWTDSPQQTACAGELISSGGKGRLDAAELPGPGGQETWYTVIVRGDGTGWVQVRHLTFDPTDRDRTECWTVDAVQLCEVAASCVCPDDEGPCDCQWTPNGISGCVDVDPEPTCDDVTALLTQP